MDISDLMMSTDTLRELTFLMALQNVAAIMRPTSSTHKKQMREKILEKPSNNCTCAQESTEQILCLQDISLVFFGAAASYHPKCIIIIPGWCCDECTFAKPMIFFPPIPPHPRPAAADE
jgi:hypothetical protein